MAVQLRNITFDCADARGRVTLADPEGNEFCVERGTAEAGPRQARQFRLG